MHQAEALDDEQVREHRRKRKQVDQAVPGANKLFLLEHEHAVVVCAAQDRNEGMTREMVQTLPMQDLHNPMFLST